MTRLSRCWGMARAQAKHNSSTTCTMGAPKACEFRNRCVIRAEDRPVIAQPTLQTARKTEAVTHKVSTLPLALCRFQFRGTKHDNIYIVRCRTYAVRMRYPEVPRGAQIPTAWVLGRPLQWYCRMDANTRAGSRCVTLARRLRKHTTYIYGPNAHRESPRTPQGKQ